MSTSWDVPLTLPDVENIGAGCRQVPPWPSRGTGYHTPRHLSDHWQSDQELQWVATGGIHWRDPWMAHDTPVVKLQGGEAAQRTAIGSEQLTPFQN